MLPFRAGSVFQCNTTEVCYSATVVAVVMTNDELRGIQWGGYVVHSCSVQRTASNNIFCAHQHALC